MQFFNDHSFSWDHYLGKRKPALLVFDRHFLGKHRLLAMVAYVLILAMLAWVGYLVHDFDSIHTNQSALNGHAAAGTVIYSLPQVSLSMTMAGGKTGVMKLRIGLEVKKTDETRLPDYEPRIIERILLYMRKQNFKKLQQPYGERELRIGLEREINRGAIPINIDSVVVYRMVFE